VEAIATGLAILAKSPATAIPAATVQQQALVSRDVPVLAGQLGLASRMDQARLVWIAAQADVQIPTASSGSWAASISPVAAGCTLL
jgi:hypothetical protein